MSSKTKSITELIEELQQENKRAESLTKLFNQAIKNEFGLDVRTIHEKLTKLAQIEKKQAEKKAQAAQQSAAASVPSQQGQHPSFM